MKKFLSILLLVLIGFQSIQSVFADQNDFNDYQQTLFDRVVSKLEPIIQAKGEAYCLKIVTALEKLQNNIKRDDQKRVIQKLVGYFSYRQGNKMAITNPIIGMDWNAECSIDVRSGNDSVTIKVDGVYFKSCQDLLDYDKIIQFWIGSKNLIALNSAFGLSSDNLGKIGILRGLLNNSYFKKLTETDSKTVLAIYGITPSILQNLTGDDLLQNPIYVATTAKDIKILLDLGIKVDEQVKTNIKYWVTNYREKNQTYGWMNDGIIDQLARVADTFKVLVTNANIKTSQQVTNTTNNWVPNQNSWITTTNVNDYKSLIASISSAIYNNENVVWKGMLNDPSLWKDDMTEFLKIAYVDWSILQNKIAPAFSDLTKIPEYLPLRKSISSAIHSYKKLADEEQINEITVQYLLSKWADIKKIVLSKDLSLERMKYLLEKTEVPAKDIENVFWFKFNDSDVRNYLLTKLSKSPTINWQDYAWIWHYEQYFNDTSVSSNEYVKYISNLDDLKVLSILSTIWQSVNSLLSDGTYELEYKQRSLSKMNELVDVLLTTTPATSMVSTRAKDKDIIDQMYALIKTMAKKTVYRSNFSNSENSQDVESLVNKVDLLKLKLIKYFLSKWFNPDEISGDTYIMNWQHIYIWQLSFRDIATRDGNTKMLELIKK